MSSSIHAFGLRDGTSLEHRRKTGVLLACQEAGVSLPAELADYFRVAGRGLEHVHPDDALLVELDSSVVTPYDGKWQKGLDVNLDRLPQGIKTIRFYNAW